jgi:hypothetical protein
MANAKAEPTVAESRAAFEQAASQARDQARVFIVLRDLRSTDWFGQCVALRKCWRGGSAGRSGRPARSGNGGGQSGTMSASGRRRSLRPRSRRRKAERRDGLSPSSVQESLAGPLA